MRPVRLAIAPHVRSHDVKTSVGERGELVAPRIPTLGKTMTQNNQRPGPLFCQVELDAIRLDIAVFDTSGSRIRSGG